MSTSLTLPIFRNAYYAKVAAEAQLTGKDSLVSYSDAGLLVTFQYANQRAEEITALASSLKALFPALTVVPKRRRNRGTWLEISVPLHATTNEHGHPAVHSCTGNCDTCHCHA